MSDVIDLLVRDATSRPSTWDAKAGTIEAVVASNAPVARRDAKGAYNEVLDVRGADLSRLVGASVLDGHAAGGVRSVIGVVTAARVESNEIIATLQMSSRPELEAVRQDIADGVIRHLSVGYSVEHWTDSGEGAARTRTAAKWTPREVSFVAIPADRNAHTRGIISMTEVTTDRNDRSVVRRTIRDLAKRSGCEAKLVDELIDNEVSIDEASAAILDDIHKRGSVRISSATSHQSFDDPEFFCRSVAEGLYHRIDPTTKPSAAAMQFVGLSCSEIGRVILQRNGVNTTGLGADGIFTRIFGGAMNTTSDFASVFMNVLDKSLRVAYEAAPSGLKQVARQTSNVDFRAKVRVMLDATSLVLEAVPESGEFKRGTMLDTNESYAVSTYGKIFPISRQALVNDDLGAFTDVSRRLGVAAAMFEANFLSNLVTTNPVMPVDGNVVFCTAHKNIAATGAAPSIATLTTGRLAMRQQTGLGTSMNLISIVPDTLVVGPDLETLGEQLITQIHPITLDGVNPFSKLKQLIVEPRLPQYGWYLFDSTADGLEYAYLASSPGPQLESRLGFNHDGLETRVRLDFGGGWIDFRSAYYNPGH